LKNKSALFLLFSANAVSSFAQGVTMMAIPWYFTQTNQMSSFNVSYAVVTLGSLFWGLYAGTLIDGFNRKDVFLGTNFVEGMIMLAIASLGFREESLPVALMVMAFAMTFLGYTIHYPNLYAFSQEVTDPKDYMRVTSLIEIIGQTTVISAAAVGALLLNGTDTSFHPLGQLAPDFMVHIKIPRWEIYHIFFMDGLAYLLSFILITFIKYKPFKKAHDPHMHHEEVGEGLKHGWNYLKNNPLVNIFGICSYSIFIVVVVEMFSLIPLYVDHHLGEHGGGVFGVAKLVGGVGSVISGAIISSLFKKFTIPMSVIIMIFMTTLAFFFCGFTSNIYVYYGICFVIGFTNSSSRIFRVTYLFNLIPNELMGRVNSIFNVITTVFRVTFILILSLPYFSIGSNIIYGYIMLGCLTLASGILLLFLYKPILRLTSNSAQH
jgi:DHA3 family macrolide efflux protein-like MFS transporter